MVSKFHLSLHTARRSMLMVIAFAVVVAKTMLYFHHSKDDVGVQEGRIRVSLPPDEEDYRQTPKFLVDHHKQVPKLNLMYSLAGAMQSVLDELEVSIKSVLLNAPLDAELDIHVVVDSTAHALVIERLRSMKIEGTYWRNQISINIHRLTDTFIDYMINRVVQANLTIESSPAYYVRLFTDEIFPVGTDTDMMVLANLNPILSLMDRHYMFQEGIGRDFHSRFMILNPRRFQEIWHLTEMAPAHDFSNVTVICDQPLLRWLKECNASLVKVMPQEWHVPLAHGLRFDEQEFQKKGPRFDFLVFAGIRPSDRRRWDGRGPFQFCDESPHCTDSETLQILQTTWAEYYHNLPWSEIRYMGPNLGRNGGHPLIVQSRCVSKGMPCELS